MPSPPRLAAGELEMLQMLWRSPGVTILEAHEALGLPIGYTTVQTRLNRLVKKGVAHRTLDRPARYSAAISPADVRQGDLDMLVERVSEGRVAPLVAHLLQRHNVSPEELAELKRLVAAAERKSALRPKEIMTAHDLFLALVRTTLAAGAAACLAAVLLAWLRVESPRTHRIAWALVVLQGWLLIPWTFRWEIAASPPVESSPRIAPAAAWEWSEPQAIVAMQRISASPLPGERGIVERAAPAAVLGWLAGAAVLALAAAWRYARIVRSLPRGVAPDEPEWQAEWRRALRPVAKKDGRRRVALRITERTGPLLAFVPWHYLVLAPRSLWTVLASPEREAILRHELAHLRRRDLWKSLAIRVLALPQWFNPLVWLAVRRFDEAAEWACDAAASRESSGVTLARSLVRAAELTAAHSAPPRAAGVIPAVRAGRLSNRIHRLVTPRFKEESIMKRLAVPALLAAIAAAQLIRIERVAASDPPPVKGGVRGGIQAADVSHSASTDTAVTPLSSNDHATRSELLKLAAEARKRGNFGAEFQALAQLPYVIEPPDILRITIKPKQGKSIGVSVNHNSMVTGELQLQCLVAMDGRVNLGGAGAASSVYVAGLTLEEAQQAIRRKLKRLAGNFKNVDDVAVELLGNNSKLVYVVDEAPNGIGNVVRMPVPHPLDRAFNVAVALEQTGPRDFKLADARVAVHRPSPNGQGSERILPVVCDPSTDAPTADTNHALLPGDRLFVRAPASAPSPPMPDRFSGRDQFAANHVFVVYRDAGSEHRCDLPFEKGMTIGAAINAAELPQLIKLNDAMITLTRAYAPEETGRETTWAIGWDAEASQPTKDDNRQLEPGDRIEIDAGPSRGLVLPNPIFPAPPAPVPQPALAGMPTVYGAAPAPLPAAAYATAAAPTPAPREFPLGQPPTPQAPAPVPHAGVKQILFRIAVIEDHSGDFAEFDDLRHGVIMISDSSTTLGAIRILEKHKLVRVLACPDVVTTFGRRASFEIGEKRDPDGEADDLADHVKIDLFPRDAGQDEIGPCATIEISPTIQIGKVRWGIDCGFQVHAGETVVVKTLHPPMPNASENATWPVYVVITPEWVE